MLHIVRCRIRLDKIRTLIYYYYDLLNANSDNIKSKDQLFKYYLNYFLKLIIFYQRIKFLIKLNYDFHAFLNFKLHRYFLSLILAIN